MAKFWIKQQTLDNPNKQIQAKAHNKQEERGILNKIFRSPSFSQLHRYALLHHRAVPPTSVLQKTSDKKLEINEKKVNKKSDQSKPVSVKDMMFNPKAPLVVAVSHSDRAANFHQSNGFHPVSRLPYHDNVLNDTPFFTHVLVLDPFSTGKINELEAALRDDTTQLQADFENNIAESIKNLKNTCIAV